MTTHPPMPPRPLKDQPVANILRGVVRKLVVGDTFTSRDLSDMMPNGAGTVGMNTITAAIFNLCRTGCLVDTKEKRDGCRIYRLERLPDPDRRENYKRPSRSRRETRPATAIVQDIPPSEPGFPRDQPELALNDRGVSKAMILDAYERDNPIDVLKNLVVVIEDRLSRAVDLSKVSNADLLAEVARRTR